MRFAQSSIQTTVKAVQQFLDENAANLGDVPSSEARKRLDDVDTALETHSNAQITKTLAASMASQRRLEARQALLQEFMQPIVRIAQLAGKSNPELQALTMPRTNASDGAVVAAARGLASAAQKFPDPFIQGGLPADFVAQLNAAADAVTAAAADRKVALADRLSATRGLLAESHAAVKRLQVLNGLVRKHVKKDEVLNAAWTSARRIAKKTPATQVIADSPAASASGASTSASGATPSAPVAAPVATTTQEG